MIVILCCLLLLSMCLGICSISSFKSPYEKAVEKLAYEYLEVEKSLSASEFMKWKKDELQLNRDGVDYRDIERVAKKLKLKKIPRNKVSISLR